METVGAYEAKTHLGQLLDKVAQGERITITRKGVAVKKIVKRRTFSGPDAVLFEGWGKSGTKPDGSAFIEERPLCRAGGIRPRSVNYRIM